LIAIIFLKITPHTHSRAQEKQRKKFIKFIRSRLNTSSSFNSFTLQSYLENVTKEMENVFINNMKLDGIIIDKLKKRIPRLITNL
jgi:hypothetical protein